MLGAAVWKCKTNPLTPAGSRCFIAKHYKIVAVSFEVIISTKVSTIQSGEWKTGDSVDSGLMVRILLKSQNSHQQSQREQDGCHVEGLGCPRPRCIWVPVAGPARVLYLLIWNRNVDWCNVHLCIADLTERKNCDQLWLIKSIYKRWFHALIHCGFILSFTFHIKQSGLSLVMTWMPLQLSSISMPHFVFQLTNQLSKLHLY